MSERRFGNPRTDEERRVRHYQRFGSTELPPRGTGLSIEPIVKDRVTECGFRLGRYVQKIAEFNVLHHECIVHGNQKSCDKLGELSTEMAKASDDLEDYCFEPVIRRAYSCSTKSR